MKNNLYISDLIFKNDSAEDILKFLYENNIKNLEMFLEPLDRDHHEKSLKILENYKFENISFHGPYRLADLSKNNDKIWKDTLESYKISIDIVKKYKGEFLVLHTNENICENTLNMKEIKERIHQIVDLGKRSGVNILVENVGIKNNMIFFQKEYTNFILENNYSALIDIGHAYLNNWDIKTLLKDLKNNIKAFHFHNNDGNSDLHKPILNGKINYLILLEYCSLFNIDANIVLELAGSVNKDLLLEDIDFLDSYSKI